MCNGAGSPGPDLDVTVLGGKHTKTSCRSISPRRSAGFLVCSTVKYALGGKHFSSREFAAASIWARLAGSSKTRKLIKQMDALCIVH